MRSVRCSGQACAQPQVPTHPCPCKHYQSLSSCMGGISRSECIPHSAKEPPSVTRQVRHRIAFVFALSADLPKLLEEKEGCRSLLQSASYPAVVQRLVKNMPVAVDAIALTKVLLGQGECPEQLKSTACAVFQLCLASLWKVHGVQPALRQHLVVRARCRYEVSAKVVAETRGLQCRDGRMCEGCLSCGDVNGPS